ncbi:hypothetical protein D6C95_07577 [Aureobasidium pullulans]|nr:hypothetical protein D6C95_07577 [Aureobasidium pullulans]
MDLSVSGTGDASVADPYGSQSLQTQLDTATLAEDIVVILDATAFQQPSVPIVRGATDQPQAASKLTTLSFELPPRTISSPLDERFVKRLTRVRSDKQQTSQPVRQALDALKSDVFAFIKSQLKLRNIGTHGMEQRYLNWCLPRILDRQIWEGIMEDCLFITPAELEQVLDLRDVEQVYLAQPTGATSFYLRTFTFKVHELLQVLQELSAEGYDYNRKLFLWTARLKGVDPFTLIYVRYAGMTTYVPWMRHLDDITSEAGSFAIAFIQKTLLSFPAVIQGTIVQEVHDARVDFAVDQTLLNVREQALISLLDSGALNTEAGGAFNHDPSTEDEIMFATLRTRVTAQITSSTKACTPAILQQVQDLAGDIQQYANDDPVSTGTHVFTFANVHRDAIIDGMTPSLTHRGMTPFLTMGSDVPLTTFKKPKTYFLEASCSAHLSATTWNHFGAWEEGLDRFDGSYISRLVKGHHVPFIDLYPWPKRDPATTTSAMEYVRRYFGIANPLVVLCHGELVSNVALGNLRHSKGLQHDDLTGAIGQVYLRNHMSLSKQDRDSGFYVAVPSLHPGSIGYRGTSVGITKSIFLMASMVGWLAYHEALIRSNSTDTKKVICEEIISAVNAKTGADTPFEKRLTALKAELAKELVIRRRNYVDAATKAARTAEIKTAAKLLTLERRTQAPRASGLDSTALTVKYVLYSGRKGIIMATPTTIWAQARKELDVVLQSGFSFSLPQSHERTQEVERVFNKHVASLQVSAAASGDKSKFINFAKSYKVPQGGSFYLSAASVEDTVKDLPNLIRCFLPDHVSDPYDAKWSRVFNLNMQTLAIAALRKWVTEAISGATNDQQAAVSVAAKWFSHMQKDPAVFALLGKPASSGSAPSSNIFTTTDDLNGAEITIKAHWANFDATVVKHSFSWMTSDGTTVSMDNIPMPRTVMPQTDSDKRFIFFVPEGVDIKDQHGNSIDAYELKGQKQAGKQVGKQKMSVYPTVPIATIVASLGNHPNGKYFLELWESQTGTTVDDALDSSFVGQSSVGDGGSIIPASYFTGGLSRPLPVCLMYNANAKKAIRDILPVYPGDALWLLHEFWTECYPEGGEVKLTNPSEDTSGESAHSKLIAFLQRPLYRQHPFARDLRAMVSLSHNGGDDKKKATTTLKSAADVLRGLSKAATNSTMRVPATSGQGSMVIGVTRFFINATAPDNVIVAFPPPKLVPDDLGVINEADETEDVDEDDAEDGNFAESSSAAEARGSKRGRDEQDLDDEPQSQRPRH